MPDHDRPALPTADAALTWLRRYRPHEHALFGVTYGLVLASALVAAVENPGENPDPEADLLWVLLTAVATAAAHGYAHVVAHRAAERRATTTSTAGTVLAEWPLIAAVLPTVVLMCFSVAGWWSEAEAVDAALWFNTAALFTWGTWAARIAGRGWPASFRSGGVDLAIGLVIIFANSLIH
ncbi:hypothetical protein G4Z16_17000 [Streptomyces bathyalis]|uniref:Integral membrane protein n=1 Tax=Streptomyces bathyalis TaxID=2710756 RepID=A0A7T1T7I9_9ACTN|nr:hypothetical protein [Streptomyces bathyalis]QPP07816.1 hypothetical protein G4Z16_17000 [Streptomyces bathyalis]